MILVARRIDASAMGPVWPIRRRQGPTALGGVCFTTAERTLSIRHNRLLTVRVTPASKTATH